MNTFVWHQVLPQLSSPKGADVLSSRFNTKLGLTVIAASIATIAMAASPLVKIDSGTLEGTLNTDQSVRIFRGVPFAAAPIGDLRWKAPQPVTPWKGVRKAVEWGNYCAQNTLFPDIVNRDSASEDCLYLHVWAPTELPKGKKAAVFVWYHGGGFMVGSGSEPRYDGEYLAKQGIIVVNVNYRLGVLGFFSHPELTKESPNHASGNYGLLDQAAALRWVQKNISAFGGDPGKVTIGGESAGSISVCGLMASPLSRKLIHGAIGESGSFNTAEGQKGSMPSLTESEQAGVKFTESIGAKSLADLRAMPVKDLLAAAQKVGGGMGRAFWPNIDGYFFPKNPNEIYAKGEQAQIPLMAGWNSAESPWMAMGPKPTAASLSNALKQTFKDKAEEAAKLYPSATDEEAAQSTVDLASDSFIVFSTWKWIEDQAKTAKAPIYRFLFCRYAPPAAGQKAFGATHAAEIPYAFNTLDLYKEASRLPDDYATAKTMSAYWANFIKTGNPNGQGVAEWPEFRNTHQVIHIDTVSKAEPEQHRARYEFINHASK